MKEKADHHDAEIVLKLYDLRREKVMRESRNAVNGTFWPKSYEDVKAIMVQMDHPLNAPLRQVASYWEMAYGFAKQGVVNVDLLLDSSGEGFLLFAKMQPYLTQLRKEYSPMMFQNTEWIATETIPGRQRFEMIRKRVQEMAANK